MHLVTVPPYYNQLTGEQKELFATGRSQEPLIARMEDGGQLALAHDKESIFVDAEGNATCNYTLKWVEQPLAMGRFCICLIVKCYCQYYYQFHDWFYHYHLLWHFQYVGDDDLRHHHHHHLCCLYHNYLYYQDHWIQNHHGHCYYHHFHHLYTITYLKNVSLYIIYSY